VLGRVSRYVFVSLACVLMAAPAGAQQTAKVTLDVSETMFTVVAAISHCGYGGEGAAGDPVRPQVRSDIARAVANSKEAHTVSAELCTFYRDHMQPDSARDLAQYVSLALNLGEPPKFELKVKEADLPPDANYVLGFVPVVKRFYDVAEMHQVWERHRAQYEGLIERFHERVGNMLVSTDVYLRMPISGYVGRSFTVFLEPMALPGQVNARNYGVDYFMVVSPAADSLRLDQIRHTYLHFIIDPLIMKRPVAMKRLQPLLEAVQTAPVDDSYKRDVSLLTAESLIRAVEARLEGSGKGAEAARQREANEAMAEGFILTRFFFDQLVKFEAEPTSLRNALPDWLYFLDVSRERKLVEQTQFTARAKPEVMSASKAKAGLADAAEERLRAGDLTSAQKLAQRALDENKGDAGQALFILAQVATQNKDIKGARDYFERTVQVAKNPHLLAWSHIYLGRISDLQAERDAALQHYKAALEVGDTSPETRAAAERGLQEPYQPRRQ
jgi:Tetratricopeptide repeat